MAGMRTPYSLTLSTVSFIESSSLTEKGWSGNGYSSDSGMLLVETIESEQATPSLSQAQRMKKLSQSGELNEDTMLGIMSEEKKPEVRGR